jgi:hypothetical protein
MQFVAKASVKIQILWEISYLSTFKFDVNAVSCIIPVYFVKLIFGICLDEFQLMLINLVESISFVLLP